MRAKRSRHPQIQIPWNPPADVRLGRNTLKAELREEPRVLALLVLLGEHLQYISMLREAATENRSYLGDILARSGAPGS